MPLLIRALCVLTPLVLAITGFNAHVLADWWLENLVVFVFLLGVALGNRRLGLSNTSFLFLFLFLCAHEYGAFYAYSEAPLGEWAKPILHTNRNHFDRLVHFLFGLLLTLPFREVFDRAAGLRGWLRYLLPVQCIMALSAVYEIIEWLVAVNVDPVLGAEFVGAQGDEWDSPEDMAMALAGTSLAVAIMAIAQRRAKAAAGLTSSEVTAADARDRGR